MSIVNVPLFPSDVLQVPFRALGRQHDARKQIVASQAAWDPNGAHTLVGWHLARAHTSLGERGQALTWLEQVYDARGGMVVYLKVHPHFDSLRGEPRFRRLLHKVGLAN